MPAPLCPTAGRAIVAALLLACATPSRAAGDPADLKDYLVNIGAGHVAANEIIGLSGSAVSNLQTPKDLVAAVNAIGDSSSTAGFGLAFSPGRSGFKPAAVSLRDYADPSRPLTRLWGSTTFSYAQNTKTLAGTDYAQRAVAVNVSYYLDAKEDPMVAGFRAVGGDPDSPCARLAEAEIVQMQSITSRLTARLAERQRANGGRPVTDAEQTQIENDVRTELQREAVADRLPSALKEARAGAARARKAADKVSFDETVGALTSCARQASDAARAKWNASHLDLVFGQGWIKGSAAGDTRLSLGRHLALALAYSTQEMPNSLFNLTLRRIDRELDLDTIAATPGFKRSSLAAARYTYGYGEGRKTYALAEVSNAKSGTVTLSNAAFKAAVGIDHKIADGMWLEFRAGRSRTADGTSTENKVLFNLKFSPESTLTQDAGG